MRYYKLYNGNGELIAIGTGYGGVEITKEEYDVLSVESRIKEELVQKLYDGEITVDDIPEEWRAEVQMRIDERIAQEVNA